jgi:MATE family multidrug resistance protein
MQQAPILKAMQQGAMPRAGMLLAFLFPLFCSSMVQVVLDLTDTWFIAQIAPEATAGTGAIYYAMIVIFLLTGGAGLAVQPLVAQAMGARMRGRAVRLYLTGLTYAIASLPIFCLWWFLASFWVAQLGLGNVLTEYALAYFEPRLLGGCLFVAFATTTGFFNGTGRTRQSLYLMLFVATLNAVLNWLFAMHYGWGVAGTAWATNTALLCGVAVGFLQLASVTSLRGFRLLPLLRRQITLWRSLPVRSLLSMGVPLGLWAGSEVLSWAVFQATLARAGVVEGAVTHIVIMLTSLAYWPALGLGMGNSTLVGQALGAGHITLAWRIGNRMLLLMLAYAATVGIVIAAAGPWILPYFIAEGSPHGSAVLALGIQLLWIAASYQFFDALNIGSGFALRGAGDVLRPTLYLLTLAWGFFLPALQIFVFAPGEGFIPAMGVFGWGALGGWFAAWLYIGLLGIIVWRRWHNRRWQDAWLTKSLP